jgi:hypothetical protein
VVFGRNLAARDALFAFLTSLGLDPIEWSEAVLFGQAGPKYIADIVDAAFSQAKAVVVLFTGDDVARVGTCFLKPDDQDFERELTPQPRLNVVFEAGLAMGKYRERTILVQCGSTRPFTDLAGRWILPISNEAAHRKAVVDALVTAGCPIDLTGRQDWLKAGDFDAALQTDDPYQCQWEHMYEPSFVGPVWMYVTAQRGDRLMQHRILIRWGESAYVGTFYLKPGSALFLICEKRYPDAVPMEMNIVPACRVEFGEGEVKNPAMSVRLKGMAWHPVDTPAGR